LQGELHFARERVAELEVILREKGILIEENNQEEREELSSSSE
jgi:hypothetical protein